MFASVCSYVPKLKTAIWEMSFEAIISFENEARNAFDYGSREVSIREMT